MSPLEYLSRYVVASRCRQRLNGVVFQRYASPDLSPDVINLQLISQRRQNNYFQIEHYTERFRLIIRTNLYEERGEY